LSFGISVVKISLYVVTSRSGRVGQVGSDRLIDWVRFSHLTKLTFTEFQSVWSRCSIFTVSPQVMS